MALEIVAFPVSGTMIVFISQAFYIEDYIVDAQKTHPLFPVFPDLEAFS
jgi:hypothetical protein